jgi:hypothetical protein
MAEKIEFGGHEMTGQKKHLIDKACEWLSDIDFDMEYWNSENGFSKEEFIEDFKKAMEE